MVGNSPISIQNDQIAHKVGAARFSSVTYRLFKLDGLDDQCEDYGQLTVYRGGIEGAESLFWLDDHHAFDRGRPERICANTAAMLANTRLSRWFEVSGAKSSHFGVFPCGPTSAAARGPVTSPMCATSCC